jgi:hypothetical protein
MWMRPHTVNYATICNNEIQDTEMKLSLVCVLTAGYLMMYPTAIMNMFSELERTGDEAVKMETENPLNTSHKGYKKVKFSLSTP